MAPVLKAAPPIVREFWAVDKVFLAYLGVESLVIALGWNRLPDAGLELTWHLLAIALILFLVYVPNRVTWVIRNWYPVVYVAGCYRQMALLITGLRGADLDLWLANLDLAIWHVYPTVWLERWQTPVLTEFLQIVYSAFIPAVLLVAYMTWKRRLYKEFRLYGFLVAVCFLASYVGYYLVPARGPRFVLAGMQHVPLQGLWFFNNLQRSLDYLERAHYDCFPSGHTALSMVACWGSQMLSKRWFQVYFTYTCFIIFATVYLRYHYTVDLLAGAVLAVAVIRFAPMLYRHLSKEDSAI